MEVRKLTAMAIAAGFLAAVATTMVAQDRQPPIPARPDNTQIPARPDPRYEVNKPSIGETARPTSPADSQLASCLIVDNEGEIALGKLAESRAKDSDVKQFAQKMVKDHTDFMQQLEKFAGSRATSPIQGAPVTGRPMNDSAIPTPGATDRPVAGATSQPMGSQELNFVQLKQQIGQKLLEMQKKDLEEKEGSQFDKCYIGSQIGAHMQVLAMLEVVRNHASPEFVAVLDKGIETTKTHLDHAQKIGKALERQ